MPSSLPLHLDPVISSLRVEDIALADFDGDGQLDIVLSVDSRPPSIAFYRNQTRH